MSIPSPMGIPNEMKLNEVDFSLPSDARSYQVKIQPSNVSQVVSGNISLIAAANSSFTTTPQFPSQTLYFDLPCGSSPSTFCDSRFTTINFRATFNVVTTAVVGGAAPVIAYQRSGGYSWFDRMYITAQNGNIVEDITEFGLVNDLMVATQLNTATRDTLATQYGFNSDSQNQAQGHAWTYVANTGGAATNTVESHSYSFPLVSSLIGCTADRFINIGRTNKLQIALQTTSDLPISLLNGATAVTAGNGVWTLSDFSIQTTYIDIGPTALALLDNASSDKKGYIHGTTYKTSSISMPAVSGSQSLLAGIRGSSIKSLFARFYDAGSTVSTTNSINGKYDSKLPIINSINFNIGGSRLPSVPCNPLLNPSQAFRGLQMASGSFNNSQFQSCIIPSQYCKLSAGGTTSASTVGGTQAQEWTTGATLTGLCQFIYGEDLEVCARRGLMSGLNCNSAPVFVEFNATSAPSNPQVMYVHALGDVVYIHDYNTGDIQVRM